MEDRGRGRGTKSAHVVVYGRTLGTILGQNRSIRLPNCYGCVAPKSNIKWWSYSAEVWRPGSLSGHNGPVVSWGRAPLGRRYRGGRVLLGLGRHGASGPSRAISGLP